LKWRWLWQHSGKCLNAAPTVICKMTDATIYRVWSVFDKAVISYYSSKYKPVPLPDGQNYNHGDVSIIVPTIDTESTFTECMGLWLKANPREIIIATVERNRARVMQLIEPLQRNADQIIIVTAPLANKRHQLIVGVKAARGQIFALVDDDVYWRVETVVPYLLAPFEDAEVGAVAGIQRSDPNSKPTLDIACD